MSRFLILFAREPAAQAREKGLPSGDSAALFRDFAAGWMRAARNLGAHAIVATPPEDLPGWRRALAGEADLRWIPQRGSTLGARLEDAARRAASLGGNAVVVGGDVPPCQSILRKAFESLEGGADAVLSPAPDGGVSLLALAREDLDLLGEIRQRRRTVLRDLLRALSDRGRRVELVASVADLDGRRSLRAFLRGLPAGDGLRSVVRRLLATRVSIRTPRLFPLRPPAPAAPCGLRAPPDALPA